MKLMNEESYIRNCPECAKTLIYKDKCAYQLSCKEDRLCLSCSKRGENHHFYGKISPRKGKIYSPIVLKCVNEKLVWFDDSKQLWFRRCPNCKIEVKSSSANHAAHRINCLCYSCVAKNRKYTPECRRKMRESAINRIKNMGIGVASFNKHACKFMDEYGKRCGYNFQHALNGGEVWVGKFSLDGYDKDKKVVFEYDEPRHEKKKQKVMDVCRVKSLFSNDKVKEIIRYSEKYNRLYKSHPTYSTIL